jgi:hypothetical protein
VSLALDGWMRQGQEREYKEYKEYKEFKEYEESANAPLGSHGLVSPYRRIRRIAQRVLCRGRCGSFRGKRSDQAPAFCQGAPEPSQYGEFSSSFIG